MRRSDIWFHKILAFLYFISLPFFLDCQVEICDNGIDDDFDNLIDLNDEDCFCEEIESKSLIPNSSFEEIECCPDDRSQLFCASSWVQASLATTDYINECDWLGWEHFPPPRPFPDGEGILGFRDGRVRSTNNPEPDWKEYAGACLLSPLLTGKSYRFQFDVGFVDPVQSPPIYVSLFGTKSCDFLPFDTGSNSFGCPSNNPEWVQLGEVLVSGGTGNLWVNAIIEVVPNEELYAIAIGPSCEPTADSISTYYYFDNLFLNNLEFFDLRISEVLHPCNESFILAVPDNSEFEYQWYLSGVALAGEVFSELTQNYGEGEYQVRILDGTSCRVSAIYDYSIPSFETPISASICFGESYFFNNRMISNPGLYFDTLQSSNKCDSIIALTLEVIGETYDTTEASILKGETFNIGAYSIDEEGEHPLIFNSSQGCDSLVLLKLSHYDVFIPNVFSPNYDNINDFFKPFAPSGSIQSFHMKIYNRWGNLVYQGLEWNGSDLPSGAYAYLINIKFAAGESRTFYGSITLLK